MTLGDKIRALKLTGRSSMPVFDNTWNAALDRAAALADEHEANIAAAYEDAAQKADTFDARAFRERYAVDRRGRKQWNEARVLACENQAINITAEDIATAIRARVPADAQAALDRLIREAEARGMEMACAALSGVSRPDPKQNDWRFGRSGFSNPMDAAGSAILTAAAKHREAGNG